MPSRFKSLNQGDTHKGRECETELMKWETETDKRNYFCGYGEGEGESHEECVQALARFYYEKILPVHDPVEYPFIIVSVWPDSGRLIAYPMRDNTKFRDEKSGCQMMIPELLAKYEELNGLPDSKFEKKYDDLLYVLVRLIADSWQEVHDAVSPPGLLDLRISDSGETTIGGQPHYKLMARL